MQAKREHRGLAGANATSAGASVWWVVACCVVFCGAIGSCGPRANDGQVTQVMQEARGDMLVPPDQRPVRLLNMNRAAELAAKGGTLEPEDREDGAQAAAAQQRETRELEARELAQQGAMALLRGDEAKGVDMLHASIEQWPTLDALEHLAPRLAQAGDVEGLEQRCAQVFEVVDQERKIDVLRTCRAARPDVAAGEALRWASPTDRAWYEEQAAGPEP